MTVADAAIREAIGLLQSEDAVQRADFSAGFIDLLGSRDVLGDHRGQRIFAGRLLPVVYERLWRPLMSRAFVGMFGPRAARERRIVLDALEIAPGDRVLDVGCGTGNYTRYLAREAGNGLVVGFDASETMLSTAAKRGGGSNIAYLRGDACALPFAGEEFAAVCSVGVLHMLEKWSAALDEMVRVLAPGGRLMVVTLCNNKDISRTHVAGGRVFEREQLTSWLADRGMVNIEQRTMGWSQFVSARKRGVDSVGD